MGADGGSIPKRIELVKTKPSNSSENYKQNKNDNWKYCAISKEPLQPPVVACKKGKLYNKEAVLQLLLDRKSSLGVTEDNTSSHIKSLKDLVKLNVTVNPILKSSTSLHANEVEDAGFSSFICPVTSREMNGNFKFVYLKGCGCVMSEQALREISSESCLKCAKPRTCQDVIELNPDKKTNSQSQSQSSKTFIKSGHKRPAEEILGNLDASQPPPYLPNERGYRPSSLSGIATFRKTPAVDSMYKK